MQGKTRFAARATLISLAVSAAMGSTAAWADMDGQLEQIQVTGRKEGTAAYVAPSQANLDAEEPQSIVNQRFIENNLSPAANYTDIINITPSVSDTTPNGRGLAESLNLSIRGFQDGQFNVTFDGIPWGDANDFTHHSTSYFTADTIGSVVVDRGPGTASQVGNATFGGTVALQSKDPMQRHNVTPSIALGSFHSQDYSVQVDTGALDAANGGRGMLALTSIDSDGAMTNNGLQRKNAFLKYVQPVTQDTTVTAVAMYNTLHQNVSQFGTTRPNLALYGSNYSLSSNVSSDSYYGFNFDDIHTDFEYLDLKTRWDGVRLDNKVYTYAYYHKINETNDPSLACGSLGLYSGNLTVTNPGPASNPCDPAQTTVTVPPVTSSPFTNNYDVTGQKGFNNYRSWGDTLRVEADVGPGVLRGGLWDVDWTLGGLIMPLNGGPNADNGGFQRDMHDTLLSLSPFVEYEWHPLQDLTVTPGVRYSSFRRSVDAVVDQGTEAPLQYSHTWNVPLPSVYANYRIQPGWSAYAQYARGFLAPNLNLLYKASQAAASQYTPQNTNNLQAGTAWKSDRLSLAADVYRIRFNNFVSTAGGGSFLVAAHGGSATFQGEELEGTVVLGYGFSLYANASHNGASYTDGTPVLNAPNGTHVLGLIYEQGPVYASLLSKRVGTQWQGGISGDEQVSAYTVNDLAFVYTIADPGAGAKDVKLRLSVSNLANNRAQYYLYGSNLIGTQDSWMTLPGRAYMVGIAADF